MGGCIGPSRAAGCVTGRCKGRVASQEEPSWPFFTSAKGKGVPLVPPIRSGARAGAFTAYATRSLPYRDGECAAVAVHAPPRGGALATQTKKNAALPACGSCPRGVPARLGKPCARQRAGWYVEAAYRDTHLKPTWRAPPLAPAGGEQEAVPALLRAISTPRGVLRAQTPLTLTALSLTQIAQTIPLGEAQEGAPQATQVKESDASTRQPQSQSTAASVSESKPSAAAGK